MILFLLAYTAGVLTVASPCILPILPFVFARADQPFGSSVAPMLIGMAISFATMASLVAVAGGWAVEASSYGRGFAIALLALFGTALVFPSLSARLSRPLVALGSLIAQSVGQRSGNGSTNFGASLLIGISTGLLWAPCAGPVLGLILTGAALQGPGVETSLLLLTYAAGASTSLALALLAGGRVVRAMKRRPFLAEGLRRGFGAAVLAAVGAISLGLDTGILTRISLAGTTSLEQGLIKGLLPDSGTNTMNTASAHAGAERPEVPPKAPLFGATEWLNSTAPSTEDVRGKVVLVNFWTYSCINCLRSLPQVGAWAKKYRDQGLVVIGVHAPEFAFEKNIDNVRRAVSDLGVTYPIAIDNGFEIWRAFNNRAWPARFFIDATGRIRHHEFGEGEYDQSERVIEKLLAEAGALMAPRETVIVDAKGAQASPDLANLRSPETYIGYNQARNFVSPGGAVEDARHVYQAGRPRLNQWGLTGDWTIGGEHATLNGKGGGIVHRFHARDLHLVLGPSPDGRPVRFRVAIDGAAPGDSHGTDVDVDGTGTVAEERLYQLIRQSGPVTERTFTIEFLDPGVQAYAFTFG
jgi:cytochrome c biogenesis protein CcdA/thiol-disulfide isomerase/thioredoxin